MCVLLGCGRLSFDSLTDAGASSDDSTDACELGAWASPVPLTAVNTSANEWGPTLSPDGLTLLFSSERAANENLYISVRATTAEPFPSATSVAELNSSSVDTSPIITRDGASVYFTSTRNGTTSELFAASRDPVTGELGAPVVVPELAGMAIHGPTVSADGSELFFGDVTLSRALRGTDGMFQIQGPVSELNASMEGYPSVSGDGRTIYFTSRRDGPLGVYSATRSGPGAPFGAAVPIAEIGGGNPDDPEISADGRALVFTTSRDGNYDLWMTTRGCD